MKLRSWKTIALLILFLLISVYQWSLISASMISLVTSAVLLPVNPARIWSVDLIEFWVASITWLMTGFFLLRRIFRPPGPSRILVNGAAIFLCLLGVVALTSPFLVPVPPNVQGDLITTRLLPPLSPGYIIETLETTEPVGNVSSIERKRQQANAFLLQRSIIVRGGKPETDDGRSIVFLFGTDDTGRDVFSRIISGTRVSLAIGVAATVGAMLIGTFFGFAAGYSNRFVDSLLMRITDLFLSIPSLFLVIGIVAFLGQSISTLIIVLATTGWMGIARMVRAEVKKLREREFVLVAKMFNRSSTTIILRHILPNVKLLLITAAVLQFGNAVLAEASLSFLGLGVQPPTASWGNMLGQSLGYLRTGWWLGVFPGLLLACVLIAAHYAIEGRENAA